MRNKYRITKEDNNYYVQRKFLFLWFIPVWMYITFGSGHPVPKYNTIQDAEKAIDSHIELTLFIKYNR